MGTNLRASLKTQNFPSLLEKGRDEANKKTVFKDALYLLNFKPLRNTKNFPDSQYLLPGKTKFYIALLTKLFNGLPDVINRGFTF